MCHYANLESAWKKCGDTCIRFYANMNDIRLKFTTYSTDRKSRSDDNPRICKICERLSKESCLLYANPIISFVYHSTNEVPLVTKRASEPITVTRPSTPGTRKCARNQKDFHRAASVSHTKFAARMSTRRRICARRGRFFKPRTASKMQGVAMRYRMVACALTHRRSQGDFPMASFAYL